MAKHFDGATAGGDRSVSDDDGGFIIRLVGKLHINGNGGRHRNRFLRANGQRVVPRYDERKLLGGLGCAGRFIAQRQPRRLRARRPSCNSATSMATASSTWPWQIRATAHSACIRKRNAVGSPRHSDYGGEPIRTRLRWEISTATTWRRRVLNSSNVTVTPVCTGPCGNGLSICGGSAPSSIAVGDFNNDGAPSIWR